MASRPPPPPAKAGARRPARVPAAAQRTGSAFISALAWPLLLAAVAGAGFFYLREYRPFLHQHAVLLDSHNRITEELAQATSQLDEQKVKLDELAKSQSTLKTQLETATKTEEQNREDLATLRTELEGPLAAEIKAGRVEIIDSNGEVGVRVSSDALFRTGSVKLTGKGVRTLGAVAKALLGLPKQHVQVRAHVDTEPLLTPKALKEHPNNWDLSAAYARLVVQHLIDIAKMPASQLSLASFADTRPVIEDSKGNGRIEFVLQGRDDTAIEPAEPKE